MQVNGVGQTPVVTQSAVPPVRNEPEPKEPTPQTAAPPPPDAENRPSGGAISRSSSAVQAAVTNLKAE